MGSHDPDAGTLVEKRPNSVFQLFEHGLELLPIRDLAPAPDISGRLFQPGTTAGV
jgi:hypothetical protein